MTTPTNIGQNQNQCNPDLKFCVWPEAFGDAVQTIVDSIFTDRALIELYNCNSEFANVLVMDVVKPKFWTSIAPGKLTWTLENAGFTIRADHGELTTVKNFVKGVSGSFTVDIAISPTNQFSNPFLSVRVNLSGTSSSSSSSSPAFRLSDFENSPLPSPDESDGVEGFKDFEQFTEFRLCADATKSEKKERKRSWRHVNPTEGSTGEPTAKRRRIDEPVVSTDRMINEMICSCLLQAFADRVIDQVNGSLPGHSVTRGVSDDWQLSFSETSMPEFQNGFMASNHLFALCYRGETIKATTPAAAFPELKNSNRMLTIFISNHVFNTIGYSFHQHDFLNYNLTQADLIPQATEDNSTTADISLQNRCLSDCFPDFSVKYPGASVEVNMASSEVPTSTFSGQNLKVTFLGSAIFRAHLADGSLLDFLKTAVTFETTVLMKMEMEKLVGSVISTLPKSITIVESALNSVNDEVLREVFNLIATQFMNRKLLEVIQKGIPLPPPFIPGVFQYENIEMQAEENYLRVDADLSFQA